MADEERESAWLWRGCGVFEACLRRGRGVAGAGPTKTVSVDAVAVAAVAVDIDVDVAAAVGNKAWPMRKVWLRRGLLPLLR